MPGADYRIAWRPKALEDLRSIVRYIAQDSPTRARTFGKKLREKVQPLAQHPRLGHEGVISVSLQDFPVRMSGNP